MQFIPDPTCPMPHPRVQAKLYDFVESLRVTAAKLQLAIDHFDEPAGYIDDWDLRAAQANCKIFASMFQEIIGGVLPTIPDRVCRAVLAHENERADIFPHFEGVVIGICLAIHSLNAAKALSVELDPDGIDEAYQLMIAAEDAIGHYIAVFEGVTWGFKPWEILDDILAGRPTAKAC